MKKAIIDPRYPVQHIVAWTDVKPYQPIFEDYANSGTVAQIADAEFPIAEPLFWVDCIDGYVECQLYCDLTDNTVKVIENAEPPTNSGVQTI